MDFQMTFTELKDWITLIKDVLLGAAALATTVVAIYGVRMWKHELAGKEIYNATKDLVKESHLLLRATGRLRRPVQDYERKAFTDDEINSTTRNERWRISEHDAIRKRMDDFSEASDRFRDALLDLRVLVGSKVFLLFQSFREHTVEAVQRVNNYIDLLHDHSVSPDSTEVKRAQEALYASENSDDELSQKIGDAREEGEKALLIFLNRKSIRG